MTTNPQAFIFFGRSGSGKGTQVGLLQKYLEEQDRTVLKFDAGSTFRKYAKENDSYTAKKMHDMLEAGVLQPDFLPIWGWSNYIVDNHTGSEDIIFEGTRKLLEFQVIESLFDFYEIKDISIVLVNISKEEATKRLLIRGRSDDEPDDIKNRLQYFEDEVLATIAYARKNNMYTFVEINGEQSIEDVHQEILEKLNM